MNFTAWQKINLPFSEENIKNLKIGDKILLSGQIYTARDKAHERLKKMIENNLELPFRPKNQVIYYVGPSPTPPGEIAGSAGPTTSYRMDPFTEIMLQQGVKGFIGKGKRSLEVRNFLQQYKGIYFSTFGGAAAFLNRSILKKETIAFDDLGPEAIFRFTVKNFPIIVINDIYGGDLYESNIAKR